MASVPARSSPASNREFAGQAPPELVKALGKKSGTWTEVFPGNADEAFQAWHEAPLSSNAIAEAREREFNITFYCNVWLAYPPAELPERRIAIAGIGYPSGGPVQGMIPIWKAARACDRRDWPGHLRELSRLRAEYSRHLAHGPDNPLWVRTGPGRYAPFLFAAMATMDSARLASIGPTICPRASARWQLRFAGTSGPDAGPIDLRGKGERLYRSGGRS